METVMLWMVMVVMVVMVVVKGEEPPQVVTPEGVYLGEQHTTARQRRKVYSFTSIPYAAPPLGDLRFRKPFPPSPLTYPFNATGSAPPCLHWDNLTGRGPVGREDCLYLNVYTNYIPEPPLYLNTQPTLVFLHAGTWMAGGGGDGLLQPDYFLENDMTVVTLNHRLGPFGFLSTGDGECPGNFGLMDQVRALEWVRDNVRYFGGMNDSVTIMGSGAGGTSAHLLLLSPYARGASLRPDDLSLMQRAISQSGTAYSPHAIVRQPRTYALKLGLQMNCPTANSKELLACLRARSGATINEQIPLLYDWDEEPTPFGAVIDSWQGTEAFLPDEPHHLIKHRQFLHIPWMMGTNREDGAFRVQDILKDSSLTANLNTDWDRYGPLLLDLKEGTSCKDPVAVARQIRDYYMGTKKFGQESSAEFVEMMTDRFFLYPTDHAAKDHCYYLKGQYCYRYVLVFSGRKSFLDLLHEKTPHQATSSLLGGRGASNPRFQNTRGAHGWGVSFLDELLYLFPSARLNALYQQDFEGDSASRVSTHMLMVWSNFVKGGDPTPILDGWPDDVSPWGAWWEPFLPSYLYYLQIDPEMFTRDEPLREKQMTFWNDLPLYENRDHNVIRDEL